MYVPLAGNELQENKMQMEKHVMLDKITCCNFNFKRQMTLTMNLRNGKVILKTSSNTFMVKDGSQKGNKQEI